GLVDDALLDNAVEHAVPCPAGGIGMAIRTAPLGRLGKGDKQCRLGNREPSWLLAEIGQRRRPHTLEVATERREQKIELEYLLLGQLLLKLQGADGLSPFARERPHVLALEKARNLHRQCRGARDD